MDGYHHVEENLSPYLFLKNINILLGTKKIDTQISMPSFLAEIITEIKVLNLTGLKKFLKYIQVRSSCNILAVSSIFRNRSVKSEETGLKKTLWRDIRRKFNKRKRKWGLWYLSFVSLHLLIPS